MSYKKGDQIHIEDDDATAASKTGHMRYILAISLFVAIALLSAIWIFGAWSQGDTEEEANTSAVMQDNQDDGADTDGVLMQDGEAMNEADTEETE